MRLSLLDDERLAKFAFFRFSVKPIIKVAIFSKKMPITFEIGELLKYSNTNVLRIKFPM